MRRATLWSAAVVLVGSLGAPRSAAAGVVDFIMEMSGPQMIGLAAWCDFNLATDRKECEFFKRFGTETQDTRQARVFWVRLQGGAYWSTGKDSPTRDYEKFDVKMVAFEPTLEIRSYQRGRITLHHGVIGASYLYLWGKGLDGFDKAAIKVVPLTAILGPWILSYNFRVFPDGFTADEFDNTLPRLKKINRPKEVVLGISGIYKF